MSPSEINMQSAESFAHILGETYISNYTKTNFSIHELKIYVQY